ncbi:uronyl 2-sulfotransferase [Misgurnus anguillicaudatus]|uniref:uronyl 2-sulfotransferase n=1 Tax=Misgurnus anguillicaudatus TaxID=75329 RepID=UPI003CCF0E46
MTFRNPPSQKHLTGFVRLRNRRGNRLAVILLRITRRDFGVFLFLFCLGSVLYQLSGGAPQILINVRYYLGRFADGSDSFPPRVFPSQVVYNRVGKCGSRTMVLLLRLLADKHQFTLISSDIHNKTRLSKREQANLVQNISSTAPQPFLYTRHVHFLNFSSWLKDISTCILENYPECSNPRLFYIIPFFCGQHPQCRELSEWALETAKQNVLEHYLLVGLLEELEDVLLLLERLLPHFFSDVFKIYRSPDYRKLGNQTVTVHKQTPNLKALKVLYQRMEYEYKFYNFIKAQFHLTKRKIGLRTNPRSSRRSSSVLQRMELLERLEEEEEIYSPGWSNPDTLSLDQK